MSPDLITLSVFNETWGPNSENIIDRNHQGLWLQSGSLNHNGNSVDEGTGVYLSSGDHVKNSGSEPATIVSFTISRHKITHDSDQREQALEIQRTPVLSGNIPAPPMELVIRLDQVDFPPNAIAYRHTHPGAGIRYLVHGGLQVASDHDVQHMQPGEAWFEEANSAVEATAISTEPTRFVRLMLLPVEYEGRPTLKLVDAEDAKKPRLQTNTRHFDKRVIVSEIQ